jgi:hypothetical protein
MTGCARTSTLQSDVFELLKRHGVSASEAKVWTGARTRTGLVEMAAGTNDVQRLVKGLKLELFDAAKLEDNWQVLVWRKEARSIHAHPYLQDNAPVKIYRSVVRPLELRLSNGSQFEYLMLYVPKEGDRILVQVSYAYG